jgi:hypothetical protein
VDPLVAPEALHVVARDQPTHAVPDHVDAFEPRVGADALDVRREPLGSFAYVAGAHAVVQREHPVESAALQVAAQDREDRPVVGHAVHHQDRGAGRFDVADQQSSLHRR